MGVVFSAAAAVVLVQITPPELVEQYGERLISACTQGLRQGVCMLAGGAPAEQRSALVADVRADGEDFRVVRIALGRHDADPGESVSGKVVFDEADAPADRWTTIGFAVATLAGDLAESPTPATGTSSASSNREPAEPRGPVPPKRDSAPNKADTAGSRQSAWRLAAGGSAGQAMQGQNLRAGPWALLAYAPAASPLGARLHTGVSWAKVDEVSVQWTSLTGGVELRLPLGSTALHALAATEAGAQVISASSSMSATRVSGLLALYLGVELTLSRPFSAFLSGELALAPATDLRVEDQSVFDRRAKAGALAGIGVEL